MITKCLKAGCCAEFNHIKNLKQHLRDRHGQNPDPDDILQWENKDPVSENVFQCDYCKRKHPKKYNLLQHMQRYHMPKTEKYINGPAESKRTSKTNGCCPIQNKWMVTSQSRDDANKRSRTKSKEQQQQIQKDNPKPEIEWTREEDKFLLEQIKAGFDLNSANVAKIAQRFPNRTPESIENHVNFLINVNHSLRSRESNALENSDINNMDDNNDVLANDGGVSMNEDKTIANRFCQFQTQIKPDPVEASFKVGNLNKSKKMFTLIVSSQFDYLVA